MAMAVRGVMLDVDGTLVRSNDAHAEAWVEACAAFGYDVAYARVRPLIGMGGDKLLPAVVPGLSSKEGVGKRINERRQEIFLSRFAPSLRPTPGARQLVASMRDRGLRLIVVTSAKREELQVLLKAAQVEDLLTEATTASDAGQSKPAPDVVQAALEKLQLAPGECRMIGDTRFDIESGQRAGVGVIAVRCGGSSDEELAGALALYADPAELLERYDLSPLAEPGRARGEDSPTMGTAAG